VTIPNAGEYVEKLIIAGQNIKWYNHIKSNFAVSTVVTSSNCTSGDSSQINKNSLKNLFRNVYGSFII
jgi:hypothetical protein